MPINSKHPEFTKKNSAVCKDAYNGNVLDYIPKLKGQTSQEYEDYRQRGVYFNATKKTVEGMIGAILRKPFQTDIEEPTIADELSLHEFVSNQIREMSLSGRTGILVDWNDQAGTPTLIPYPHECIINWRSDYSLIVLEEKIYEEDPKDPYELVEVEQYRELMLDEDGYYAVRLWRETGKSYRVVDEYQPTIRGERLAFIPFIAANAFDTTMVPHDPIILNMSQLNISHFKSVVDVEHGTHFTALPTPVISGDFATDVGGEVSIGSTSPWHLEEGATASFLEFSGAGLAAIEKRIQSKEDQMAVIGSKLLSDRAGVEAAESLRIRSAAESATMVNIVNSIESQMRQALDIYSLWEGGNGDVMFEMSRDFTGSKLTAQEMTALMQLYLNGAISQQTFLENLYEGEITQDVEKEIILLRGDNDLNGQLWEE